VFSRPYESLGEMEHFKAPVYEKSPDQLAKLLSILKKSFLTKNLSDSDLKIIGNAMQKKTYKEDDIIIKYGDDGQEYYILENGAVEIIVYNQGTDPNDPEIDEKVAFSKYLSQGVGFGEIALLYDDKRTATVRAADECDCWVLDGKVFKTIVI